MKDRWINYLWSKHSLNNFLNLISCGQHFHSGLWLAASSKPIQDSHDDRSYTRQGRHSGGDVMTHGNDVNVSMHTRLIQLHRPMQPHRLGPTQLLVVKMLDHQAMWL